MNNLFQEKELLQSKVLSSTVQQDSITKEITTAFDFEFDGKITFTMPRFKKPVDDFNVGLVVGPSGSGKSNILQEFNTEETIEWDNNKAVCSHFATHDEAIDKLSAVGFNTIPSWLKPYHVLSTGEKFRVDLAKRLKDNAVIDEFTSVVDRNVAKSCANALGKYIKKQNLKNIVFASCHYDIIDWLQPDWVFDTTSNKVVGRRWERRPKIVLEIFPCSIEIWSLFRENHYLTGDINRSARCWIAIWEGNPVGFESAIPLPTGTIKEKCWREHRLVILPDFQGLGIGARFSEWLGESYLRQNIRFFSKTAHPRLGQYREHSDKWKPTSSNKKNLSKAYMNDLERVRSGGNLIQNEEALLRHMNRICYSHEYIGAPK